MRTLKKVKDLQLGMLPSVITVAALMLGVHALRFLFLQEVMKAVICIVLAALLDGLDGKVARFLNVSSKFGGTLDSMADFLNFGIVPPFIIYVKYFNSTMEICWISVVAYVASLALRLARFAVVGMADDRFFTGVPAPGAAFLAIFPLCCDYAFGQYLNKDVLKWMAMLCLMSCSFLMLSKFKTVSLSRMTVSKQNFPTLVVILCVCASLTYLYTWYFIIFLQIFYLYSIIKKK